MQSDTSLWYTTMWGRIQRVQVHVANILHKHWPFQLVLHILCGNIKLTLYIIVVYPHLVPIYILKTSYEVVLEQLQQQGGQGASSQGINRVLFLIARIIGCTPLPSGWTFVSISDQHWMFHDMFQSVSTALTIKENTDLGSLSDVPKTPIVWIWKQSKVIFMRYGKTYLNKVILNHCFRMCWNGGGLQRDSNIKGRIKHGMRS